MISKKRACTLRKERDHSLFRANTKSEEFDYLEDKLNHLEAIILFGSFRKGEDIERSDIDIAIITQIKDMPDLNRFEKILHHKVSLFLFSRERIEKMKVGNKELLNNLVNGIILRGFWELFR
ncbi:nucleotidyltransferase domain-containing protein [Candidatus Woesearchaeota archaeon]|nr:nucleotidyltransferase domain-containing protein [Candidatus Woesearchaeota archaeon]